ncbi:MAG: MFS transporter [Chroococcus sp. CMT-3BRIN-NPC107]|nr:MFS transporter [Chroococcus sp. CMT-3BRIN-NPC107]
MPQLDPQVWILAIGRLLSEVGTGFTLFYAPIFFVNQVGLSATAVGFALGSASISGVVGRILGGSFSDSQYWGRRKTLLLSAAISAIASLVLASANNFLILVIGNLLVGLGQGLYWPANESVVADLTAPAQRHEAYAVTRLADNLGLGMGVVLGGALISTTGAYRSLFIIDAISFVIFFGVVYFVIKETYKPALNDSASAKSSWQIALSDRRLLIYVLVNIIFTTYVSQLQSTLPLYLKNFVSLGASGAEFTEGTISLIFGWNLAISILTQLPVVRGLRRFTHPQALSFSALMWAIGFTLVWVTGVATNHQLWWAVLAVSVFAIAIVSYTPSASALITELAPKSQLGVYFSISSLCWAAGYFIGPPLGGFALDQTPVFADNFWLWLALSVSLLILMLYYLEQVLSCQD